MLIPSASSLAPNKRTMETTVTTLIRTVKRLKHVLQRSLRYYTHAREQTRPLHPLLQSLQLPPTWQWHLRWNAIDRFCFMPRLWHRVLEKCDMKQGSWSDMIHSGTPNQGTRCFRYSLAMPGLSMVLRHRINFAALEHPWSTMVKIESKPSDLGRSVIRSIDINWKGPFSTTVSKGCKGAFI